MSSVITEQQTAHPSRFGSTQVLSAAVTGICIAGAAFGACYGFVFHWTTGLMGAIAGGLYATAGGLIVVPFVMVATGFSKSARALRITHTIGGAATALLVCLPMLGSSDTAWFPLVAAIFGATAVWVSVGRCLKKTDPAVIENPDAGFLARMTR